MPDPARERYYRVASGGRSRYLETVVLVALLAPLAIMLVSSYHWGFGSVFMAALLLGAAGAMAFAGLRARTRYAETAVLRVDEHGLALKSDVSKLFGSPYQRPWTLAWREIAQVAVMERLGVIQMRRRRIGSLPVVLRIRDWVPEDVSGDARPPRDIRTSELWQDLASRGFLELPGASRAQPVDFDLMRHPATRAALFAMAVFGGYWFAESFVATEAWAEWNARYLVPHFLVASLAAATGFVLMRGRAGRSAVPFPVVAVMAVMLGGTAGLASWSALLRVNQFAGGPLVEEAYVRSADCDTLLPKNSQLPPIEYTELARGYWCQFGAEHVHHVRVRRGLGGLYQVDLRPHTKAIREYRRAAR